MGETGVLHPPPKKVIKQNSLTLRDSSLKTSGSILPLLYPACAHAMPPPCPRHAPARHAQTHTPRPRPHPHHAPGPDLASKISSISVANCYSLARIVSDLLWIPSSDRAIHAPAIGLWVQSIIPYLSLQLVWGPTVCQSLTEAGEAGSKKPSKTSPSRSLTVCLDMTDRAGNQPGHVADRSGWHEHSNYL